jgi:hypothetical protein
VTHPAISSRGAFRVTRQKALHWFLQAAIAQVVLSCAYAQYTYDPSNPDEQAPGIRYFGSAKDERGVLIPGVSVFIVIGGKSSFVFVTDDQGRYRGTLPLALAGSAPDAVAAKCSKAGYQFVKAIKRPGMGAPKPYMQVDCVLHLAISG